MRSVTREPDAEALDRPDTATWQEVMAMDPLNAVDLAATMTDSVIDVFDTMLSVTVGVSHDLPPANLAGDRYVGTVKFAGEMVGIVSIHISSPFARFLTAEMMGVSEADIESEEEITDLIAELSNIIGGKLKSSYTDIGLYCELSPPSITKGSEFTIESLNMEKFEQFAFTHQDQTFLIEVGIKQGSAESEDIKAQKTHQPRRPIDVDKYQSLDLKQIVEDTVVDVYETMLSLEAAPVGTVTHDSIDGERMVGSVNFAGDITGIINIHISHAFAREMTASMLGVDIEALEGQEEINDLIGELSNIIGGSLKSAYTDIGLICELSTPSITTGKNFAIESLNMNIYNRLAFKSGASDFFVEVGVKISEGVIPAPEAQKAVHYDVEESPSGTDESRTVIPPAATPPPVESPPATPTEANNRTEAVTDTRPPPSAEPAPAAPGGVDRRPSAESKPGNEGTAAGDIVDMDVILDIPLDITVELGHTRMPIRELLSLEEGSAVPLDRLEGEPVDILANDTLIAKGIVMVKGEKYAIQITEITSRLERIRSLQ